MERTLQEKRLFLVAFCGLIALHASLILSSRLLPFTDIPDHLAAATIARHIDEPGHRFADFYRVETGIRPNTFHLIFCSLPVFPSPETANRVFYMIYAALLPISALLVMRRIGGSEWFAFLPFLLIYNYNVSWGFAGFAFAIPLVLLFYRFFILDPRGFGSPLRAVCGAAFFVALYFVHVLAALFAFLVVFLSLLLGAARRPRGVLGSVAASLPVAILSALWWRGEAARYGGPDLASFLAEYYRGPFLRTLGARKALSIFDNYHLFDGAAGLALGLLFSAAILVPALILLCARRGRPAAGDGFVATLPLLLASALCCLLLPNEIPQQSILYERFGVYLFLALAVAAGALAPPRIARAGRAALVGLALLHLFLWAGYFIDFNRENAGLDRAFFGSDSPDMKLAGLLGDFTYRGKPLYIHFPSYYIVWREGIATANLADYRFGAVRRKEGAPPLPRYLEWVGKRRAYDGRYGGMDYILLRGEAPAALDLARFEAIRRSGAWTLLRARK